MRCSQHLTVRGGEVLDILERREREVTRAAWKDCMALLNACFKLVVLNLKSIQLSWLCDFSQTISVALGKLVVWSNRCFYTTGQYHPALITPGPGIRQFGTVLTPQSLV